jgi:alpha-1,3-rhamnosyl/mannosyltransferase
MKSVDKLTIGLESRLFAGAMTGIGNYCFHLLRALMTDYPELSFVGFDWRSWKRLDAAALCEIENSSPSLEPDGGRLKNAIHQIKKKGRTRLARVPLAQAFYRSRFSRLASQQSLDLFHAFNYLPVADPGATTLPVVYDLSSW